MTAVDKENGRLALPKGFGPKLHACNLRGRRCNWEPWPPPAGLARGVAASLPGHRRVRPTVLSISSALRAGVVVRERVKRAVGGAGSIHRRKACIGRIKHADKLERAVRSIGWRWLAVVNVCDVREHLPHLCRRRGWCRRGRQRFDERARMPCPSLVDGDRLLVTKDVQDRLQDLVARVDRDDQWGGNDAERCKVGLCPVLERRHRATVRLRAAAKPAHLQHVGVRPASWP